MHKIKVLKKMEHVPQPEPERAVERCTCHRLDEDDDDEIVSKKAKAKKDEL